MAASLLAHLYTHIKGSQEDIATLSLQYILSQSNEINREFTKRIASHLSVELDTDIQYVTQATGKNKERPDLAGIDTHGTEQVLCEMKFYAGLTPNQPLTYLNRLKSANGKGLIFICPNARLTSLWTKLKELCSAYQYEKLHEFCIKVNDINLAIMSWAEVLELLTTTASSAAIELLADIKQLEGYCAQMDSDAFIPFTSDDLTADIAKKAERYYRVIDETISLLCDDDHIVTSAKGLKASAYRNGYTRSLYIDNYAITLNYDRTLWKSTSSIETPFWVALRDKKWVQTDEIKNTLISFPALKREDSLWGLTFLALEPLTDSTLLEVCSDLKTQILEYLQALH